MLPRHQLPALSPIPPRAILGGASALFSPGGRSSAAVTRLLESEFEALAVVLTNSGTSSLRLAIQGVARERPGPLALPAFCCYDVSTAAEGAEAPFVLYDIDPYTLGPDFDSLRAAVRAGASGIVVAHLYGIPVDLATTLDIAEEEGVLVIEDAAQGAGAKYAGRRLGSHGNVGVLSFARGKGITGGGGGALLATDQRGVAVVSSPDFSRVSIPPGWRELAGLAAMWVMARPRMYGLAASLPFLHLGETVYREPTAPGPAARSTLGTLRETWPIGDSDSETRRRNAAALLTSIEQSAPGLSTVGPPPDSYPSYLRLPVLASPARLDSAATREARRLGIALSYPRPINRLERSGSLCVNRGMDFPGANALTRQLITLPTHSLLTASDLEALKRWTASLS